ncbi:MAG: transglutaminase domain-containing protein [Bacteroidaceae bacterium]|nr:transglutaminase domain-containing protein [Bacteroidaceae bacterium]
MKKALFILIATAILSACNTPTAEQYVAFLYDNMAMPDSIDYPQSYFSEQVEIAMRARKDMPWGKEVPEREFRHFVLPPRVSNEDLDDFRTRYYEELSARVASLGMTDAILEINHWCHEHVTYRPTSARTLGPASTIRTAYGRCGEESVLLVAALRTVGIPARQVYTPRWAHTDDNHAWVEAWADGQWHFLGACEPEPVLGLGWFNESASRGMLMHTKVFGRYDGPEEVVKQEHNLTEINVTDNYAPTRQITVQVIDTLGTPVEDVTVDFKIYNYAEFFTVASKHTDSKGQCTFLAGLGDMLVWASTDTALAYEHVSFSTDSLVALTLRPRAEVLSAQPQPFDIVPPASSAKLPQVSDAEREENNRRLAVEDSIRHAYEATMTDERSRGNHAVITSFLDSAAVVGRSLLAEQLISTLPDKDLQDVTIDILFDNIPSDDSASSGYAINETNRSYLLSPRIERERLTPFKAPLRSYFHGSDAESLIAWTRDSITVIEGRNPQGLRLTPLGVFNSRKADALGRDIFFVAACRSVGIPARINEINSKVQYLAPTAQWIDVSFEREKASDHNSAQPATTPHGTLRLTFTPTQFVPDAKYYTHFTLSRLNDDNRLQLMTFPEEATFQNTFAAGVELDAGTYVLTSGTRMANGSVLASVQTFEITENNNTSVSFILRENPDEVAVIGSLNAEDLYLPLNLSDSDSKLHCAAAATSLLATCGRGYYIVGLIAPNHEPTNHALRDIALVGRELEDWGRGIVLLFANEEYAQRFNVSEFKGLPSTVTWGCDIDGAILREAVEQQHLTASSLPIFLICDSFNRVVHVQQGYTIGIGEQLLKVIKQL